MQSKTFRTALVFVLLAAGAYATPHNTIILDGIPTDYTADERVGSHLDGHGNFGPANLITNLYVTWDSDYLYVMLQGYAFDADKLVVMIDAYPGEGTGATTTTNWIGDVEGEEYINFNSPGWVAADPTGVEFGLDFMIANSGPYNNVLQILYAGDDEPTTNTVIAIFDHDNGATPVGSEVDVVTYTDDTACDLKGMETRIPWSVIYGDGLYGAVEVGEIVPRGAKLRLFATLHNNERLQAFTSDMVIPSLGSGTYTNGVLMTAEYIEIEIDPYEMGMPDNPSLGQNPPFLRDVMGKAGGDIVYARFNKPVTEETVTNTANWLINGLNPNSVTNPEPDTVYIFLAESLPMSGLVDVRAVDVEDADALSRETYLCLSPAEDGLDKPLTVRFVLETNSGMGRSRAGPAHGASAFFINGDSPLEWGFPPSMSKPVDNTSLGGSLRYADVIFPPGTPLTVNYKFSALLTGTGTNNYEAVRLDNYLTATRVLTLDPDAPEYTMYVTNHLGAAAAPLRGADVEDAYEDLYWDWDRGDAGVRQRKTITFQLDLSEYDTSEIQRVLIQGTDPLRGFNLNDGGISDWAGLASVGWAVGGIALFDDGTMGDEVAGDGIFSRTWSMTADGADSAIVPGSPHSLVGGSSGTSPFGGGAAWVRDRTPRSFKYQYYVINEWGDVLNSPGFDVEVYIEPGSDTNIVFEPFVWDGVPPDEVQDASLLPDPTNAPTVSAVSIVDGRLEVPYGNETDQRLHLVDVTDDLVAGFRYYGERLPFVNSGVASFDLPEEDHFYYRIRAGRTQPRGTQWTSNPVSETGGVGRIYFRQDETQLAGHRDVGITGSFTSPAWSQILPLTFAGNGLWYFDLEVPGAGTNTFLFKFRDLAGTLWWPEGGGNDYHLHQGEHASVSWSPNVVNPGEVLTITFDVTGTTIDSAVNVNAHSGFDYAPWEDRAMTNVSDQVWELGVTMPTNNYARFSFVFNNGAGTWYSEGSPGGRKFTVMITPVPGE